MSTQKKQKLLKRLKNKMLQKGTESHGAISPIVHVMFVVVIIFCGVLYLMEVNETSTQGFKIRSLEQQVDQLEDIQKELELRQAEVNSLHSLNERAHELELVSVDKVHVLTEDGELALSK